MNWEVFFQVFGIGFAVFLLFCGMLGLVIGNDDIGTALILILVGISLIALVLGTIL